MQCVQLPPKVCTIVLPDIMESTLCNEVKSKRYYSFVRPCDSQPGADYAAEQSGSYFNPSPAAHVRVKYYTISQYLRNFQRYGPAAGAVPLHHHQRRLCYASALRQRGTGPGQ